MKLTLLINNMETNFTAPFISGRMLRKTLEFQKNNDLSNIGVELLDTMVDYVVELFDKQFTQDQFYDGIASTQLVPTITRCLQEVVSGAAEATKDLQDPNGPQTTTTK